MNNFLTKYVYTIRLLICNPKKFYEELPRNKDTTESLIFALTIGLVVHIVSVTIKWFSSPFRKVRELTSILGDKNDSGNTLLILIAGTILALVTILIAIYIWSWISQLLIKRFEGKGTYNDTFNVVAYSLGAVNLLNIFPALLIALSTILAPLSLIIALGLTVWQVFLIYTGYKTVHELSDSNAIGATLIPLGVFLLLAIFLFFLKLIFLNI